MKEKVAKLQELLSAAVEKNCETEVGVVFSGGIDSVIIAMLASKHSKVTAYACGIKGAEDIRYAKECEGLGFEIKYVSLDDEMVEEALKEIVKVIGDRNPVKAAVEVPFYFASKKAAEDGFKVMLCGQGSDELFGGYSRYVDCLKNGFCSVEEMMKSDVENMYESQLKKDVAVCKNNGIELRAPYMDPSFIEYVRSLPFEDKIRNCSEYTCVDEVCGEKYVRKYVLRLLGIELGVPEGVLHRKKKAAQYGSGTQKVVERLAKKRGYREKAAAEGRTDYVRMYLSEL